MTTAKQLHANRKNAQHSSGPKTSEGKVQSSINARSHGLNQAFDLLVSPEITVLQTLFENDGLSEEVAFELAQAHCGKARVRRARAQAWSDLETPFEDDPDRSVQRALAILDRQRCLNRYDVKAVSTLSKLYKQAYSIQ